SNFVLSFGWASATTSLVPLFRPSTTTSTSGPSAGRMSLKRSSPPVCFVTCWRSFAAPGKRPRSAWARFHWSVVTSVFSEMKTGADAGATEAPSGTEFFPPPPPPPQPAVTRASAAKAPSAIGRTRMQREMLLTLRSPAHKRCDEVAEARAFQHAAHPLRDRQLDPEAVREVAEHGGGGEPFDHLSDP